MSSDQKKYTKYSLAGAALFIALSFGFDTFIVRFLLVGELPGRMTLVSPDTMLAIISLIAIMIVAFAVRRILLVMPKSTKKPQLPSRRYQSLQ